MLNRIYWMWRTWYWRSKVLESAHKSLAARAKVEQVLFNVANRKRPFLTQDECRELALTLGTQNANRHGTSRRV